MKLEPQRVLLVFGKLNRGGAETLAMNIYRNIDRDKIQFDFIVHTPEKCDYDNEVEALGGKIYRFPRYNGKNHFTYKRLWNEFFKEHGEYRVLHAHMTGSAAVFIPIAKKYGLFTISHSHIAQSQDGFHQMMVDLYRYPLKRISDYMFACSSEAGEWMFGKNIRTKPNYMILKNGVDVEKLRYSDEKRLKIRKEFGLGHRFVVGNISRFHIQKNHSFLLDIFNELLKAVPDAALMLVGAGELEETIRLKAENLGISENIIFTGVREDIPEILSAIDAFVMPSFREGLPVSLIEAQASGLPVVVSDTVSGEVKITELVEMVSLNESAQKWAETVLKHKDKPVRPDVGFLLEEAGYDIKSTASMMERFYLAHSKERR